MRASIRIAAALMLCAAVAGCTRIQLISAYDEQTDTAATALQRSMSAFFVRIISAVDPKERNYAANLDFYRQVTVDFSALSVRAQAINKNRITIQQIDLTQYNLAWLILMHKGCITDAIDDEQRRKIVEMGPDLSMDCRIAYGADMDAPNRGDERLNPAVARLSQRMFDQQLGAIITLEAAKRRGE